MGNTHTYCEKCGVSADHYNNDPIKMSRMGCRVKGSEDKSKQPNYEHKWRNIEYIKDFFLLSDN